METLRRVSDVRFVVHHKRDQHKVIYDHHRDEMVNTCVLTEEQKQAIDVFYQKNYGRKTDYRCHRFYTACSDRFDSTYITEDTYIPEIDHYLSMFTDYIEVFQDKNVIPFLAESLGIMTPRAICKSVKGYLTDSKCMPISYADLYTLVSQYDKICIKKSVGSSQGKSVYIINPQEKDGLVALEKIIKDFRSDFVIQEVLTCHKSITDIYPRSVNTFRIMTYRWHNHIKYAMSMLRMGRGQMQVDNASLGGIFIGIKDDGSLMPFAITKYGERFLEHPDTGTKFEGYKIDLFPNVVKDALRMHQSMPQIGVVHWDFTLDKDGLPVLIEGNLQYGGIWALQMANGKSAFGDDAAEVLQWVRNIKKIAPSDRYKHAFGNI